MSHPDRRPLHDTLTTACLAALLASASAAQSSAVSTGSVDVAPRRLVNAPVAPEAIYVGRGDSISVLDLNGFGQGSGELRLFANPRHAFGYKRNPNLGQPGQIPPYAPGASNATAGSAGALTLTRDQLGSTRLVEGIEDTRAMALGQPLDLVYNNENVNRNVTPANQLNPFRQLVMPGNTIALAPVPNPPPFVFPAPNPARGIETAEPTTSDNSQLACLHSSRNMLVMGDPFSQSQAGIGLFYAPFPGRFFGPQPPPPSPPPPTPYCPYSSRQQVGHFLYVLDRVQARVHVYNSNRMTRLASVAVGGPNARLSDIAMSPKLKVLAVADAGNNLVHFLDTEPTSARFHTVLGSVRLPSVGGELAWQPEGEALLVSNARSPAIAIVDGRSFTLRSIVSSTAADPIGVAVSARQFLLGLGTWTWFAYILERDGSLSVYESGPRPIGPGIVRRTGLRFANARAIHIGATLEPTCYIAHSDANGDATVSQVETRVDAQGVRSWRVRQRIGGKNATTPIRDVLSGSRIVDIAFDEIENKGAHEDIKSALYPDLPTVPHSSKGLARKNGASIVPSWTPRMLFVALADQGGKVDVVDLATGRLMRSVAAPGVQSLGHYWRQ